MRVPSCLVLVSLATICVSQAIQRSLSNRGTNIDPLTQNKVKTMYRTILSLEAQNYCLCIQSNSAGFLVRKYWKTGSFKACQTAFRTEFGERRAPSKCSIQKLIKKLETRGSRSNACRLLSLGGLLKGKVYKNTPRTIEQLKDAIYQEIQAVNVDNFGKSIPEFAETHSSVLGCERRPVSASIMSRSCFASFPV